MNCLSNAPARRALLAVLCFLAVGPSGVTPAQAAGPLLVIGDPREGGTYASAFMLTFFTDGSNVQCSLDGQPLPCSSGQVITGLGNGPHTLQVSAANEAGEVTSASSSFLVDAIAPTITDVSPSGLNGTSVVVFFSSSDTRADGTVFDCFIDGQAFAPCEPGIAVPFTNLFDGPHQLVIRAQDVVGNQSEFASPFEVDGLGPVFDAEKTSVPVSAACPRSTLDTQIRFFAEDARRSNPVSYLCSLDLGAPTPCTPGNPGEPRFNWRCLAPGNHLLTVFGVDRFGNPSGSPLELGFQVERSSVCPIDACAGPDQRVNEGASVVLDGSLSTGTAFSWSQIAGPAAAFDGSAPSPSFAAPILPGGTGSQVLSFRLTMTSGGETDSDSVDVTVKNLNLAPVADAGPDQSVKEGSSVRLTAASSFDPDGDALAAYQWVQTEGPQVTLSNAAAAEPTFTAPALAGGVGGPQLLAFQLTVSDGELSSTVDEVRVGVEQDNHAPVADAGADQTKTEGTIVTLNGSGTRDPDGDPLRYAWTQILGDPVALANADTAAPSFTAPAVPQGGATLAFRLGASDGALAGADEVLVNVRKRNDPPLCHLARPSSPYLWPPNHKLMPISIAGVTDPDSPGLAIAITAVTQDEPVNGMGDGDTAPDAVVQGGTVLLRAERAGGGNGRVYRVAFTADDGSGGTCSGAIDVLVPHSARATSVGNDGLKFDSTRP